MESELSFESGTELETLSIKHPTETEQLKYKVFKAIGTRQFSISKDLFTPYLELNFMDVNRKRRIFKGMERELFAQLAEFQKIGTCQMVLIFI
jgi:hypothetical protein